LLCVTVLLQRHVSDSYPYAMLESPAYPPATSTLPEGSNVAV
jgi:hypothetical protein